MKYFTGKRFTLNHVVILLVLTIVAIAAVGYASSVGTLNTFSPGSAISSSAVNTNFSNIASAVNDNNARITTLENKQIVTVVAQSANIGVGSFGSVSASCPAGYNAIGGGVDSYNILYMYITASGPRVGGTRTVLLANGTLGPANGWQASAFVPSTAPAGTYYIKIAVICSQ